MSDRTSRRMNWRQRVASALAASAMLGAPCLAPLPAAAGPEDEVRAAFEQFVTAQNAHDTKAVEALLLPSPDFLWITRGTAVWGPDAAMQRFGKLYEGTWRLDPEAGTLKVFMLNQAVAQLYVPINFAIGAAGQPSQQMRFLMNQIFVKTPSGWKVSSILPILAPAP